MTITGLGAILIQLRRKAPTPGEGRRRAAGVRRARRPVLSKNVHIIVKTSARPGSCPARAQPEKGGQTPLDLRCRRRDADRPARAPPRRPDRPARPGPGARPDHREVPDQRPGPPRGPVTPDQLNCDTLDLTLMPGPKATATPAAAEAAAESTRTIAAPGRPLGLGRAAARPETPDGPARGHAVWLQSESQGMKARVQRADIQEGDRARRPRQDLPRRRDPKKLWVEKIEYDTKGPDPSVVKSVLNLYRSTPRSSTTVPRGARR